MGEKKRRNPIAQTFKALVLYPLWGPPLKRWRRRRKERNFDFTLEPNISVEEWERRGRPAPPPHEIKRQILREFATRFKAQTFIETGTFRGDMVNTMLPYFQRLLSIELSPELHALACKRFAKQTQVTILQGDSGKVLQQVLAKLDQTALFWLDGHYSTGTAKGDLETPINQELRHIFQHSNKNHVILIDDARLFVGQNDYPTLDELRAVVAQQAHRLTMDVADDIIRIYPAQ